MTTRRHERAGERINCLRRGFEVAVKRAKLPADLHQHDLRHRRVTTWLAAGGDAVKVKEAMGHADLRTTMDYTHLVRENLRSLVDSVGRFGEDSAEKGATTRESAAVRGVS
jgi:site-specific recombinase XerD